MLVKRALFEKLARLPEWARFRDDFQAATGFTLRLVDDLGRPAGPCGGPDSPLCRLLAAQKPGAALCARFRQNLLASASQNPARARCDAGLCEAAVPIQIGDTTAGYFVFGGFRNPGRADKDLSRARHLLETAGVALDPAGLRAALEGSRAAEPRAVDAFVRFVQMAVRLIAERLTHHLADLSPGEAPDSVRKACALVRQEALVRDIGLAETARRCGVSEGHLSRSFHRAMGMTFSEFVARFRSEHARDLLADRSKNITEIARLSGFGSLSQFHRTFRRVFGRAPSAFRKAARAA